MFSKIVIAALCSTAVSAGGVYPEGDKTPSTPVPDESFKPITVIPGCVNLWAGK